MKEENLIDQCNSIIVQANQMLPAFIQMYKEGDVQGWNFKLAIVSWNIFDMSIGYKNHVIDNWYIVWKDPKNIVDFNMNWDASGVLLSTIKVDYSEGENTMTWQIVNWEWDIDVLLKGKLGYLKWKISFKEYIFYSYDIKAEIDENNSWELTASWTLQSWKINWFVKDSYWQEIVKLDFNYDVIYHNLDFLSEDLMLKSNYKDKNYDFKYRGIKRSWEEGEWIELSYKDGDISWGIFDWRGGVDTIKWKYNNLKDFNINIESEDSKLVFKTEVISLSELNYIMMYKHKEETLIDSRVNIKEDDKGWYIVDINWYIKDNIFWWYDNVSARNSKRILDLSLLSTSAEQYYMDSWEYPTKETFNNLFPRYLSKVPKDPLEKSHVWSCKLWYIYEVWDSKEWVANQTYKLSTCLEWDDSKVKNDEWSDDKRYEIWRILSDDFTFKEKFFVSDLSNYDEDDDRENLEEVVIVKEDIRKDWVYFNSQIKIRKWWVKYEIPTESIETDIKINEMIVLPDYTSISRLEFDKKKILVWWTAWAVAIWVWSINIYSEQIKKAQDSVRITDLMSLRAAIEQYYQVHWEYPTKEKFHKWVSEYIPNIPKDPSSDSYLLWCKLWYIYEVWDSKYWLNQAYKLSTCFESKSNIDRKAKVDGGTDAIRFEVWLLSDFSISKEKFFVHNLEDFDEKKVDDNNDELNNAIKKILKEGEDYEIVWGHFIKMLGDNIWLIKKWDIVMWNKVVTVAENGKIITFERDFNKKIIFYKKTIK